MSASARGPSAWSVICIGLALAPWGGLQWAIYLLAATAWITVGQRIWSVRTASSSEQLAPAVYTASTRCASTTPQECLRPYARSARSAGLPTRRRRPDAASTTSRSATWPPASRCRSSRAAGQAPTPRGRIGAAAHASRAEATGSSRRAAERQAERERAHRRDALRAARLHRKGIHGFQQRKVERQDAVERQGPRRDHRRRQLRQLAAPGRASTTRTPSRTSPSRA